MRCSATCPLPSSSTSRSPPPSPRRRNCVLGDKLITLAKKGGLSNRRLAHARLLDDAQLVKLFDVLATRYADRNGGYTRIIKAGIRLSDASPMAIIEFVDRDVSAKGQDSGPVLNDGEYDEAA